MPRRFAGQQLPPGPTIPAAIQTVLMWSRPLQILQACRRRYGSVFTLRVTGHLPLVFVCHPDAIRALFRAEERLLQPGHGASAIEPIVGSQSFMLQHGVPHRETRKALRPLLDATAANRHIAVIERTAQAAIETWPTRTPIDLHPRLRALTLEITLRVITGQTEGQLDPLLQELHHNVLAMLEVTRSPVLTEPYLRHGPGQRIWKTFLRNRERVDQLLLSLIQTASQLSTDSLLPSLMALPSLTGAPASSQQIRDDIMSIILAGHETTAAQLAWALHILAHNPAAQACLVQTEPEAEARLSALISEILRHSCVFLFGIPRTLTASIEIDGCRCEPPAQLLPCIYLLHRDQRFHNDPEIFVCDRYLQEQPNSQTWLPWGGGTRRCPGHHLATSEIKTILRTILQARSIKPSGKNMPRPRWRGVIVSPANCRLILCKRPI